MKRNILLPTDFSDNSWSAIAYALKLFVDTECTFYFLNSMVLKASALSNVSNKVSKTIKDSALKELQEVKSLVETNNANSNHDFQIILSAKDLKTAIENAISEWNIDMIVMATKGATGAKEFFFGSHTVHIINNIKSCPVLVIPDDYYFTEPKQIAFPTDFNRFFNEKELDPLKDLADLYNAKIRIMHINVEEELNDVQEYNLMMLQKHLLDYEHSFHWMPDYDKKVKEIDDFIEELDVDILAMVNYKHSFIENILNEPVIKKIGFHPRVPFFVIPE